MLPCPVAAGPVATRISARVGVDRLPVRVVGSLGLPGRSEKCIRTGPRLPSRAPRAPAEAHAGSDRVPSDDRDAASQRSGEEASSSSNPVEDRMREALLRQVARSAAKEVSKETAAVIKFITSGHNVDAAYLRKRRRSRWWSKVKKSKLAVPAVMVEKIQLPDSAWAILRKMLPLGAIFFGSSFNLTLLQNLRDALVVTTSGAEVLPFLSALCVLPASILFFMYYSALIQLVPQKAIYYVAISTLVAIYAVFAVALYPIHTSIHLYGVGEALRAALPAGLHGLATVVQDWTLSLFFCFAEIWGSVVISLLFWGLANDVCSVDEAKTIYPLMGMAANVGLIVSGSFMKWAGDFFQHAGGGGTNTQALLQMYVATMVVVTGAMFAFKGYIDRTFLKERDDRDAMDPLKKKKKKKGSMQENLALLTKSPKILNLALLVMCYSVAHRLFEFSWKGQLRTIYPTMIEYQSVLASVSIGTGWATMLMMLLGRFVFQYLGWGFAAQATPLVMLLSGGFFFISSLAPRLTSVLPLGGFDPTWLLTAGALAGCITQVFARSSKFSLFDPAKEMVYIEMSKEEKQRGKAAVDLIGAQVGKSGGAWITQALLLVTGTLTQSLPFVMGAFTFIIAVWLRAARQLEKEMKRTEERRTEEIVQEQEARDKKWRDESALWQTAQGTGGNGANGARVGAGGDPVPMQTASQGA